MKAFAVVLALVAGTAAAAQRPEPRPAPQAATAAGPAPVRVSTWVSRTAVWVGDPVEYVVELRAAPHVDILTDDLQPDRLSIRGLEVLDVTTERIETAAGTVVHRLRYRLVTYAVDEPDPMIAAAPVRYAVRQPGLRTEDAATAGELLVPPLVLGFRSTLPASEDRVRLRDGRAIRPLPALLRFARPAGLTLILLSIVPAVVWGALAVQAARRWRTRRPARQPVRHRREALEAIRQLPTGSSAERRDAFAQLDTWVRQQLREATGVEAFALTPGELTAAVPRPPRALYLPDVERLLAECEQAKYAPEPPAADRWPAALDQAEQLLRAGRR